MVPDHPDQHSPRPGPKRWSPLRGDSLELPLGDLAPQERVLVEIIGDATPRQSGRFPNLAVASAANAKRAAAETTLFVTARPEIHNAFDPARVPEGFDGRVHYGITLTPGSHESVVVFDREIGRILDGAVLEVRGARYEGDLASGLATEPHRDESGGGETIRPPLFVCVESIHRIVSAA